MKPGIRIKLFFAFFTLIFLAVLTTGVVLSHYLKEGLVSRIEQALERGPRDGDRLVSFDGDPKRVEVRSDDTLVEAHELDSEGRVSRSLFLEPRPDGTVEITYRRGDDGSVVEMIRLDRAGRRVGS